VPADATYDLPTYLTQIMGEKAVSVRELSEISGLDEETISRVLRGLERPSASAARALADGLDVPYDNVARLAGITDP
jgi:transcriptional regulator with XRE-family HTH domain